MTFANILVFSLAYVVAAASPGPAVAAVLAQVLSKGLLGILPFILGFVVGDLIWFAIAATGLAVVAETLEGLFLALKYGGAAYLSYLAYKLWTAPVAPMRTVEVGASQRGISLFLASLSVTLGNPKTILFFMALLPSIIDLGTLDAAGFVAIAATIIVILATVLGGYALAAARTRRLFRSPTALRTINRVTGTVMAGAAIGIATR